MTMTQPQQDAPASEQVGPARRTVRASFRSLWDATGMLFVFLLLYGGCYLFVPNFGSWFNFTSLLSAVVTIGLISCTMLFCLAAGDFDLSVGSIVAMAGVICALTMNATGSITLGVAAALAAGAVVGFCNGFVIARLGINALITTLATMQIARGIAYIFCHGNSVGIRNTSFSLLGTTAFPSARTSHYPVSLPVWIMLGAFVIFGILLNKTVFGRNSLAVGGNAEAARLAGIRVVPLKIVIFTLQGIMSAFAGVIIAAMFSMGDPNIGRGLELDVISACVLGGVSLTGGVGTMLGVVVGVLIMGTVRNAMNLLHIETFYQYVVSGGVLLAAVLLDRLRTRG